MPTIGPEKWNEAKDIFYEALQQTPEDVGRFLDESCSGDEDLRREVDSLLRSSQSAGSFMQSPAMGEVVEESAGSAEKLNAGQMLGRYKIISHIGAGGMGEIFLAEDTRLHRRVALKVLPEDIAADKERLRRFEQEANAASALNHPNILTVHEFGFASGVHFLVTEFVEGQTLREKINESELSLPDALNIAEQIAFALLTAHASGIVHRDVKPENIMIRRDGFVKVLDFGLAKLIETQAVIAQAEAETRPRVKTQPGIIMGTASYMSPEQARGRETDGRTDTFSLGIVLYEMLTGFLPFPGETMNDSISAILTKEAPPLSRYLTDVPAELERIVRKALMKSRDDRYQTARDLMTDIKSLRRDLDLRGAIDRFTSADSEHKITGVGPGRSKQDAKDTAEPTAVRLAANGENKRHSTSSAEYIVTEINKRKLVFFTVLSLLLAASAGLGYWFYSNRTPSIGAAGINSIAILPFENGSGDANLDYLSDGLSESLIDSLSRLQQLKVIARSSSFKYRGDVDLQEVAKDLAVQAIVTGKVVQRGDSLIVRVEMIDALDNRQLWSEQFNRKVADAITVQQEIAQTVSEKLRLKLTGAQEQQLAERSSLNPLAYETLLKARFYWNKGGDGDRKKAVEYLNQAIAVDPNYGLAYAELAYAYSIFANDRVIDQKEALSKAEQSAAKAFELDESLAEAHHALAYTKQLSWDWAAAEREYQRAVELNPNYALAHATYSLFLGLVGRQEQAIASARRAKELDPFSIRTNIWIFNTYLFSRRYEQALEIAKHMQELEPNHPLSHYYQGIVYTAMGRFPEAIAALKESDKRGIGNGGQVSLGLAYAISGQRDAALTILKDLQDTKKDVSQGDFAALYAQLGDKDKAFEALEKAYETHDSGLVYMRADPFLDNLRSDPRFADLLRRVGLPL